ncbi:MAG: DUF4105 domain-containing protein [Deltaproteobacteria bacterium]|nr:DUF4105 domain-containing protein [Deltaproteobacteria bacterium]
MTPHPTLVALLLAALALPTRATADGPPKEKPLPQIVLYFGGPGDDPFSAFGHVAICIVPPDHPDHGLCFDYGAAYITSFSGLMWGFLRGRAEFQVVQTPEHALLTRFHHEDRTLHRLVLPLTPDQVRLAAAKLHADTLDPNWRYRYDHQYDNCATRIRDLLDLAVDGAWATAARHQPGPGASFRDLSRTVASGQLLLMLTADLLAGRAVDTIPDRWDAMFLPEVLQRETERFFGVTSTVVLQRHGPELSPELGWGGRYWFVILGLLFGLPLAAARRSGRCPRTALACAALPLTLLGLLVWTLAIVSTLPAVRWNEAALALLPLDLLLLLLPRHGPQLYARLRLGSLAAVIFLLALGVLRQPLWEIICLPLPTMLAVAFLPVASRVSTSVTALVPDSRVSGADDFCGPCPTPTRQGGDSPDR